MRAMSVAFDDQGQMVPKRGTTSSVVVPPSGAGRAVSGARGAVVQQLVQPRPRSSGGQRAARGHQVDEARLDRGDPGVVALQRPQLALGPGGGQRRRALEVSNVGWIRSDVIGTPRMPPGHPSGNPIVFYAIDK